MNTRMKRKMVMIKSTDHYSLWRKTGTRHYYLVSHYGQDQYSSVVGYNPTFGTSMARRGDWGIEYVSAPRSKDFALRFWARTVGAGRSVPEYDLQIGLDRG